jgi:hypothetical protein
MSKKVAAGVGTDQKNNITECCSQFLVSLWLAQMRTGLLMTRAG